MSPSYPGAHPCHAHWTMSPQHAHFSCSQAQHKGSLPVESLGNHFCLNSSQCYAIAFGAEMPGNVPLRRPGLRKLDFGRAVVAHPPPPGGPLIPALLEAEAGGSL